MFRQTASALSCVAVLGAAGGVGQTLSMVLKYSPLVSDLRLYDLVAAKGVAEDLSQVPLPGWVSGYGPGEMDAALDHARLVIICAGVPRRHGMVREDLFNANAVVVDELVREVARCCPQALVGLVTDPQNCLVAVAANSLTAAGAYDRRKLFGVNALDVSRATTFLADVTGRKVYAARVPLIGGHSGTTLVPLFSVVDRDLAQERAEYLTHRLRSAGDDVVRLKQGKGSSTLCTAYAVGQWVERVLRALGGETGLVDCCQIDNPLNMPKCRFFSSPYELGVNGVEKVLPLPKMSPYEEMLLDRCLPDLEKNIRKGMEYQPPTKSGK